MIKLRESKLLVASLIALSLGFALALSTDDVNLLSTDDVHVQMLRITAGFSIALWALSVLLIGVTIAIRIKLPSQPIALGVTLGVLPTLLIAFLHLLPLSTLEEGSILFLDSVSDAIHRPVKLVMQETDLFSGIYSSHASPRHMIFSWLAVTAASAALWGLVAGLAGALFLKIRRVVGSSTTPHPARPRQGAPGDPPQSPGRPGRRHR